MVVTSFLHSKLFLALTLSLYASERVRGRAFTAHEKQALVTANDQGKEQTIRGRIRERVLGRWRCVPSVDVDREEFVRISLHYMWFCPVAVVCACQKLDRMAT